MVRKVTTVSGKNYSYQRRSSRFDVWQKKSFTLPGSSATLDSIGHKMPLNTSSDVGGPLLINKTSNLFSVGNYVDSVWNGPYSILDPYLGGTLVQASPQLSDTAMDQKGTTAIARCEPTNPIFDAATFIGELREGGLPKASGLQSIHDLKYRTLRAKNAGDEYLNVEFGWKPLVSDLHNLSRAVKNSHAIMASYRKGSGHKIRKAFSYPEEKITEQWKGSFHPYPAEMGLFLQGYETTQRVTNLWFSGAFRYYLPTNDSQMNKFHQWTQEADKLYGLRLTPETIWNLSPWSWAADWFGTTGDVMHNISALGHDGLVLQYGYVMHSTEYTRERFGAVTGGSRAYHKYTQTTKQRRPATPYGFGVNLQGLSVKQIAILSALGLSRT